MDKWEKADELISQMSIDEKIHLLGGEGFMRIPGCDRLGIPGVETADGPLGVRMKHLGNDNCTAFPCGGSLASTWNEELAEKMGKYIAKECIEKDRGMILGPGVNLKRTLQCGRNFEYFSEDPVLAGKMAAGYIRGVENEGVGSCVKHFVANNQEMYRNSTSVDIDERTLRDLYLKVFKIAMEEGKPSSVMMACNRVNGIYTTESNYIMREVVRDAWGYEGFIMSDWYAARNPVISFKNGLNLAMPYREGDTEKLKDAFENGEFTEADIDTAIRPTVAFLLGVNSQKGDYNRDEQHKAVQDIATEGVVLLKNENSVLPITHEKYKKITVVGGYAEHPVYYGSGSARVYPAKEYIDSPINEIKKLLDDKIEVSYVKGYEAWHSSTNGIFDWRPDFLEGHGGDEIRNADLVVMFLGRPIGAETEDADLDSPYLLHFYNSYVHRVRRLNENVVIVLQTGSAFVPHAWNDEVPGVVQMWMAGEGGGKAIADVLCGKVNPSGKMPETMPRKPRTDIDFPGDSMLVRYDEKLEIGYRYYDKHPEEIAYPFGHGLSYTTFDYSDFSVKCVDDNLHFKFTITNTGDVAGKEIAQIYFEKKESFVVRSKKELISFAKTRLLEAGESQTIEITVPIDRLAYFNVGLHQDVVESGKYTFLLAASSTDIRLKNDFIYEPKDDFTMDKKSATIVGIVN